jgi:N-acetylneuraminic acid mutarotase
MLSPQGELGVAGVDGKIYAIGGKNGDLAINTNEQFDPNTNTWTAEAPMPTPRSGVAVAVYQDKIYVFGGSVGNGFVGNNEVYDPATNTWETKASMPTPRSDLAAVVAGDKIYLIGGERYTSLSPFFTETSINEVYDPANDTWTTAASMPSAAYGCASAYLNGKIYVIGGCKIPGNTFTNTNQVYDVQTDQWGLAASLPNATAYGTAAAANGYMAPPQIDFFGGYTSNGYTSTTDVYFPGNNSWGQGAPMPNAKAYLGSTVIDDVIYTVGGYDGTNWLSTTASYNPPGYGEVPPQIQITSPKNMTYSKVSLSFSANRNYVWAGYSLDGQANVTVTGTTQLVNLTNGQHTLVLYANDSLGNMGESSPIYFGVDTTPPKIAFLDPQNKTYGSNDIQLTFTTSEPSTLTYSLDGEENQTILGNVSLPALSNGAHFLTVYATDSVGNVGGQTVYFNIEPFPLLTVAAIVALTIIVGAGSYLLFYRHRRGSRNEEKNSSVPEASDSKGNLRATYRKKSSMIPIMTPIRKIKLK